MSSPDDLDKFNATPFYASDDFWPFIEGSGSSSRLNIEDNNTGLSPFLFDEQEKFPLAQGKTGNSLLESSLSHLQDNISNVPTEATCPIVQENSCHHPAKEDNNEINSCLLVLNEQENSALIEPGDTLLASGVNYQCNEDDYLSKFLEAFDHNTIKPIDEDHQGEKVNQESPSGGFDSSSMLFPDEQETSPRLLVADGNDETVGRGEDGNRIRGKNPRSSWKKREHNVKEKERRMKLNESFLALEKLLPNSQKSKKRSSIPVMIDRAVKYIPELQKEVDKLNQKKNELVSSTTETRRNLSVNTQSGTMPEAPTISVNEVVKGEVIIKTVCTVKDQDIVFSHLLQNVEAEGMSTISGSTLQVNKEWVCCHLHVQMPSRSFAVDDDYVAVLTEKYAPQDDASIDGTNLGLMKVILRP